MESSKVDALIANVEAQIEKLKTYKQSLITEVVTKGLDHTVPMKDSGVDSIGLIPRHWEIVGLSKVFSYIGGYAFNSSVYVSESNNQVIRIGNVKNDHLLLDSNPVYVDNQTAESAKAFMIQPGMILFTMTGTKGKRDYFFTHLVTDEDLKEKALFINQRVGAFVAKRDICLKYFCYLLKCKPILDSIFVYETGTANQGNLGIDRINRTRLHLPPLSEQEAIAAFLDNKTVRIDALIDIKQKKIGKLNQYKQSLIYEYVTGKKEVS